jgi:tetrahydromethanopterin S-methyltransferase subunit F
MLFVSLYYPFLTLITSKQKGQSGMENTETQTTLITRKQKGQLGMENTEIQTTLITMLFVSLYFPFLIAPSVFL